MANTAVPPDGLHDLADIRLFKPWKSGKENGVNLVVGGDPEIIPFEGRGRASKNGYHRVTDYPIRVWVGEATP